MDLETVLRIILMIVAIITLLVIIIQLIRVVNKLNQVLDNAKIVSNGIAEFTSSEVKIKENVSDLAGMTVDKVVGKQVERVRTNLASSVFSGIFSFLKQR